MPKPLLLVGTGGLAKEIGQLARRIDPDRRIWDVISYVAAGPADKGTALPFGRVDYCDADIMRSGLTADVAIAVADPMIRARLSTRYLELPNLSFPNLIHPSVHVDPGLVALGKGNLIAQGVIMTCDIVAGDFNLFNKGCMIGHDVAIGSCNVINLAASVSGRARIGDCCMIGAGARVLENIAVADRTTLGAGAVLLADIAEPGHTFVGVPAKRLH
jgi:sugar O-acyltransferase (sialic acid O-acetyltransferase NeuD family)